MSENSRKPSAGKRRQLWFSLHLFMKTQGSTLGPNPFTFFLLTKADTLLTLNQLTVILFFKKKKKTALKKNSNICFWSEGHFHFKNKQNVFCNSRIWQ